MFVAVSSGKMDVRERFGASSRASPLLIAAEITVWMILQATAVH